MQNQVKLEQHFDDAARLRIEEGKNARTIIRELESQGNYVLTFPENFSKESIDAALDKVIDHYFPVNRQIGPVSLSESLYPERALGRRLEAYEDDLIRRIWHSSGFQSGPLAEFLERSITPSDYRALPTTLATYLYDILKMQYIDSEGKVTMPPRGQISQAIERIRRADAKQLHGFFLALIQRRGLQPLREAMWREIGDDQRLQWLFGGFQIRSPTNSVGAREWRYSNLAYPIPGRAGERDAIFSRYVFDLLFDRYVQEGGRGDWLQ